MVDDIIQQVGAYTMAGISRAVLRGPGVHRPATPSHIRSRQHDSEKQANLFAGAMGAWKNPASDRTVDFDDPVEVAEVI
ncbi:hypothetical protein AB0950_39915 [Streptomyces sp. NPDC007189]|uniref:hypothetical protein n=1 Tax=Streptomyces sp. NPDC007189 TaxID=3154315 RepID=UPI003451F306